MKDIYNTVVIPLFEVFDDVNIIKKKKMVYLSNGAFFKTKESYEGPKKVFEIFSSVLYNKVKSNSSCKFCKIIFAKENNVLIVDGKNERSPTTTINQLKLINKGLYLLIEPSPWHLLNEIIVPIKHYNSMFDLGVSIIRNIIKTSFWLKCM